MNLRAALLLSVVGLAAACTGAIGGHDPPTDSTNSALCAKPTPGPAPLRRLTQTQYDNVVRDLLGDTTHPARGFPNDATAGEFSNNATTLVVAPLLAQRSAFSNVDVVTDKPDENAKNEARASLLQLHAWLADWSECARAVIQRRDQLLRLGIGKRQKPKAPTPPGP